MTIEELARKCAESICGPSPTRPADVNSAEHYIYGALCRAVEEDRAHRTEAPTAATSEVHHTHTPMLGSVDVKISDGRDAIGVEVDVTRPREDGESWEVAQNEAVDAAVGTYLKTVADLAALAIKVGPRAKEQKA